MQGKATTKTKATESNCSTCSTSTCNNNNNNQPTTADYWVGETIGEGRFGRVVCAKHKGSNQHVALKVYDRTTVQQERNAGFMPMMESMIWTERTLLQLLDSSPWVVSLWSAFYDAHCVYLVMECLEGGTLLDVVKAPVQQRQDSTHVAHYTLQLLQALKAIHSHDIIHCDLKPENVLLTTKGRIKLADFGSAVHLVPVYIPGSLHTDTQTIPRGTVDYASPELLRGIPPWDLTRAVDYWSLGCLVAALLWGQSPFHAATDHLATQLILQYVNNNKGGGDLPLLAQFDNGCIHNNSIKHHEEWKALIVDLLHPNPTLRLGMKDNQEILPSRIPGHAEVDLQRSPSLVPPPPPWVSQHHQQHVQRQQSYWRDGAMGWSVFLL
jgi:serine/threonine protein kinase